MSYEKHTWQTGETITADKLNNLENGVASSESGGNNIFVVTVYFEAYSESYTFDCDYDDIASAIESGKEIYVDKIINLGDLTWRCFHAPVTVFDNFLYTHGVHNYKLFGVENVSSTSEGGYNKTVYRPLGFAIFKQEGSLTMLENQTTT